MSSQRVSGTAVQRTIAVLGSAVFFVVAPCTLAGVVSWSITGLALPAPFLWLAPTRNLVVTGLYRYVRNPIYVAVVAIILGQAVLMGDWRLIVYGTLLWLAFHVFVVAYEEPHLARAVGRGDEGVQ